MSGDSGRADFTHDAEMGFSHAELLSRLPSAVAPHTVERRSAGVYVLRDGDGNGDGDGNNRRVELTLQPQTERRLGPIALPVTRVQLEFFGFDGARFDAFMCRFKRYLHKGGG